MKRLQPDFDMIVHTRHHLNEWERTVNAQHQAASLPRRSIRLHVLAATLKSRLEALVQHSAITETAELVALSTPNRATQEVKAV